MFRKLRFAGSRVGKWSNFPRTSQLRPCRNFLTSSAHHSLGNLLTSSAGRSLGGRRARLGRNNFSVGSDLAVSVRGAGEEVLLLIHGIGCCKENFHAAMEDPSLAHMTRIAVDLPGHGMSPSTRPENCTMEASAEALRAVLAGHAEGKTAVHIVAHSMGGAPGLILAQDPPLEVASFLNIEGNLIASDCGIFSKRTSEMSAASFREEKFPRLLERCASAADLQLRSWARWSAMCDPDAYHAAACSLVEWSEGGRLLEMFLRLPARKLYVYGERSLNPEVLEFLEDVPSHGIPECGHFVMTERPQAFAELLADFVSARGGEART